MSSSNSGGDESYSSSSSSSSKLSPGEVAAMVARGEVPSDVRAVVDRAPDPLAVLPGPSRRVAKPWEDRSAAEAAPSGRGGPEGPDGGIATRPVFVVDSFSSRPFAGNPAAVVLVSEESAVSVEDMRNVAREMALSETAFVVPIDLTR